MHPLIEQVSCAGVVNMSHGSRVAALDDTAQVLVGTKLQM
jgi:hypothetical protein